MLLPFFPRAEMPDFSQSENSAWFALRVRSNFERTVSANLRNKGYEEFLPAYKCGRRWSDRIKLEELPLFSGYTFCRLDLRNRLPIMTTPGVVQIVGNGKMPVPVSPRELEAVWQITHSDLVANPWTHLAAGEKVVIDYGPLAGLEGVLVESKNHCKLVVSVSLLQRSVAVEIEKAHVHPVAMERMIGRYVRQELSRVAPGEIPKQVTT